MLYNPPLHFALGLSALLIGLAVALSAPATSAEAEYVRSLPVISAARLDDPTLNGDVLVEGSVSEETPPVYRNFVAFAREEYRSTLIDRTDRWIEAERTTQPFAIRLRDGDVAIVNDDYDFPRVSDTVREAEPTVTRGAVRSRGLRVGATAFAVGALVDGPGGRGLRATQIYPGTRAQFLADAGRWSRIELQLGLALSALGLAELALGGWQLRRFLREIRAEAAPEPDQRGRRA